MTLVADNGRPFAPAAPAEARAADMDFIVKLFTFEMAAVVVTQKIAVPIGSAETSQVALALLIVVYLHVVVGEMIPKNIAIAGPERAALLLVPPLMALTRVLRPAIRVMETLAKGLLEYETLSGDEIKDLLDGKPPVREGFTEPTGPRASAVPSAGKTPRPRPDAGGMEPQPQA